MLYWGFYRIGIHPGQYWDEETGNHYNWNRYYDPGTGRYVSKDPLSFDADDVNLYRYASSSPLGGIDPFGLYESPAILRATVPGQVAWDDAVTSFERGNYLYVAGNLALMISEQVMFVLSFGESSAALALGKAPKPCSACLEAAKRKPLQDHHLINQALLNGKKPHPFIEIAKNAGVDIRKAKWNIKAMEHQGGHTRKYYDSVRSKVNKVYAEYLEDASAGKMWDKNRIEKELKIVADDIYSEICKGTIKLYK